MPPPVKTTNKMPADRRSPICSILVAPLPGHSTTNWKSHLERSALSEWPIDDDFLPQLKEFLMIGDQGAMLHKDEGLYLLIEDRDDCSVLLHDFSGPEFLALRLIRPRVIDLRSMD